MTVFVRILRFGIALCRWDRVCIGAWCTRLDSREGHSGGFEQLGL